MISSLFSSLAYVRRGQITKAKQFSRRFKDSVSTTLKFDGDGQTGIKSVLGVSAFQRLTKRQRLSSLVQFSSSIKHINLLTALTNLMTFITEGNQTKSGSQRLTILGAAEFFMVHYNFTLITK